MDKKKYSEIHDALCEHVESLGFDCSGFELVSEGRTNILRIYLDIPGGVDLDDCERVSRAASEYLDTVEDALPDTYLLEVSSPGLERPLFVIEDYRRFAGEQAEIKLIKGSRQLKGILRGLSQEGEVLIETGDGERKIPFDDIKRANLVYVPQTGQKKTFKKIPKKKK